MSPFAAQDLVWGYSAYPPQRGVVQVEVVMVSRKQAAQYLAAQAARLQDVVNPEMWVRAGQLPPVVLGGYGESLREAYATRRRRMGYGLLLSVFAPWAIMPLLMLGGLYLCYEGAEKVYESLFPHAAHEHEAALEPIAADAKSFEDRKVASAIKTDFILSAEIMAITLAAIPAGSIWMQASVVALVGIGITAAVYGVVALIVKADDAGLALARNDGASVLDRTGRALGRMLVRGMPAFLTLLSVVGTAALIWVGGGIVLHGLEVYGPPAIGQQVKAAAEAVAHAFPPAAGVLEWIAEATISGVVGLLVGAVAIPVTGFVISPAWKRLKGAQRASRNEPKQ